MPSEKVGSLKANNMPKKNAISLDKYLMELRRTSKSYSDGLNKAKKYVSEHNGKVLDETTEGVTTLILSNDEAFCFQPYADIDLFFYEM